LWSNWACGTCYTSVTLITFYASHPSWALWSNCACGTCYTSVTLITFYPGRSGGTLWADCASRSIRTSWALWSNWACGTCYTSVTLITFYPGRSGWTLWTDCTSCSIRSGGTLRTDRTSGTLGTDTTSTASVEDVFRIHRNPSVTVISEHLALSRSEVRELYPIRLIIIVFDTNLYDGFGRKEHLEEFELYVSIDAELLIRFAAVATGCESELTARALLVTAFNTAVVKNQARTLTKKIRANAHLHLNRKLDDPLEVQ
jgi:hypothetical protein